MSSPYRKGASETSRRYYVDGPWVVSRETGRSIRARFVVSIDAGSASYVLVHTPQTTRPRLLRFYGISIHEVRRLLTDAMDNDPECVKNL